MNHKYREGRQSESSAMHKRTENIKKENKLLPEQHIFITENLAFAPEFVKLVIHALH